MGIKLTGLILLFSILFSKAFCQNLYVTGRIINKDTGTPLDNASIRAYQGANIILNTTSDSTGYFKIDKNYYKRASYIIIHSLNFDDVRIDKLPPIDNSLDKDYDIGTFKISIHSIQLKDVIVKAKKRYRDTTIIDLSKQKFERSIMIDDLLSKNHGFYKDENGQIFYNGKLVTDLKVNGSNFFNGIDKDIYKLLPALILKNIQIIETNIDSTTNTTLFRPTVSISLNLKEKYINGKFGKASFGAGTSERYFANTNIFIYKKNQQVSFALSSNNINRSNSQDPPLDFPYNQSNATSSTSRFTYRNLISKQLELNLSIAGNYESKNNKTLSERSDGYINQTSSIISNSQVNTFKLDNSFVDLKYRLNSNDFIAFNHLNNININNNKDLSSYEIIYNNLIDSSFLNKQSKYSESEISDKLIYEKQFKNKKGRVLTVELNNSKNTYNAIENNIGFSNNNNYNINTKRVSDNTSKKIVLGFSEPITLETSGKISLSYQNEFIDFSSSLVSDTTINFPTDDVQLKNNYYEIALQLHTSFKRFSFSQTLSDKMNIRDFLINKSSEISFFNNINFDSRLDFKINNKKDLSFNIKSTVNYPNLSQLTSINNNSFDVLYQQTGNFKLKPETDNKLSLNLNVRKNDSLTYSIFASADYIQSKIAPDIISKSGSGQNSVLINAGNALSAFIGFQFSRRYNEYNSIRLATNVAYSNFPSLVNSAKSYNRVIAANQSLSTSVSWIGKLLNSKPSLNFTLGNISYSNNNTTQYGLTYSDRLSLDLKKFSINTYILFNVNHSINTMKSYGVNAEVKKEILKGYCVVWIKAYDIFNTFKLLNNIYASTYIQTNSYSNLQRYVLAGISFNFNNMK